MSWWDRIPVFRWLNDRRHVKELEREAARQLAISRMLHAQDLVSVNRLAEQQHRNQFSDMIRDALAVGYDGKQE